jgi:hypothetical protein
MRLLIVALLMLPSAAGAASLQGIPVVRGAQHPSSAECPQTTKHYAYRDDNRLSPRKLTELPPANAYSAVYRHIGQCEAPIVVKYRLGYR